MSWMGSEPGIGKNSGGDPRLLLMFMAFGFAFCLDGWMRVVAFFGAVAFSAWMYTWKLSPP